jgi:hypothetical protein
MEAVNKENESLATNRGETQAESIVIHDTCESEAPEEVATPHSGVTSSQHQQSQAAR